MTGPAAPHAPPAPWRRHHPTDPPGPPPEGKPRRLPARIGGMRTARPVAGEAQQRPDGAGQETQLVNLKSGA